MIATTSKKCEAYRRVRLLHEPLLSVATKMGVDPKTVRKWTEDVEPMMEQRVAAGLSIHQPILPARPVLKMTEQEGVALLSALKYAQRYAQYQMDNCSTRRTEKEWEDRKERLSGIEARLEGQL